MTTYYHGTSKKEWSPHIGACAASTLSGALSYATVDGCGFIHEVEIVGGIEPIGIDYADTDFGDAVPAEWAAVGDVVSYADTALGCHSDLETARIVTQCGLDRVTVTRRLRVVNVDTAADDDFVEAVAELGDFLALPE